MSARLLRLAVLLAAAVLHPAAARAAAPLPVSLRIAVSRVNVSRLNEQDALTAMRLLATEIGVRYGYEVRPSIFFVDDYAQLASEARAGRIQLAFVSAWDFVALGLDRVLDARFVSVSTGRTAQASLLLVRADHPFRHLADLHERHIRVLHNGASALGSPWLDSELLAGRFGSAASFFSSCELVEKPSAAVLQVFFGRIDACVVDENAYQVMVELNPAVARELTPIARSEAFSNALVCFGREPWEHPRLPADLERGVLELATTPAGRQALALFKLDRLDPCPSEQLDSVRALHRRWAELSPPSAP